MFNNDIMQLALQFAQKASIKGEVPVGAVIIDSKNNIIAQSHNQVELRNNPLFHAEILAIEQACLKLGVKYLTDCTMFVTLEPCSMCAAAISFARIEKLYFGAYDIKSGGVESGTRFYDSNSCHHRPEIYGGICEKESNLLLKEFFEQLRK
jgi:tRNA(adenine34) deaminase